MLNFNCCQGYSPGDPPNSRTIVSYSADWRSSLPATSLSRSMASGGSTKLVGRFMKVGAFLRVGNGIEAHVENLQRDFRNARLRLRLGRSRKTCLGYEQFAAPLSDLGAILHGLDGFEGIAFDRHAGCLQQLTDGTGRRLPAVPVRAGGRVGVDDHQHDPSNNTETDLSAESALAASSSNASRTPRTPMLSDTPPSTRWMKGRSLLFWKSCISR